MLALKERVDILVALEIALIDDVVPCLVGMEHVNLIEQGIAQPTPTGSWTEMMEQDFLYLIRTNVGITGDLPVWHRHINQWYQVAGTYTRHGFDGYMDAQFTASLFHSVPHLSRTTGLAAVLHAQAHFALVGLVVF